VAKKLSKQNNKLIEVSLRHVMTPDANTRLSRALDMLLERINWGSTEDNGNSVKSEGKAAKAEILTKRSKKVRSRKCRSSKNIIGGKT